MLGGVIAGGRIIGLGPGRVPLAPGGFTPASVPQLVAAFSGDYGVTNSGANVAGAYGTSRSLSVPSGGAAPTVDSLGMEGHAALLYPGGAVKTHKTDADIVAAGAFRAMVGWRADHASSTKTSWGRDTNNQEAIRWPVTDGITNATMTARVCSVAAYSLALGRPIAPGGHYDEIIRDAAGLLTVMLDGETLGSQAGHTGISTWSSLGYNAGGANTWQGLIGEILFFDESVSAISAENLAALRAYMQARWRTKKNVDFAAGNDANDTSRPDRARKTLLNVMALPLRPEAQVAVADDNVHDADPIYTDTTVTTASSTSTRPWAIKRRGNGAARPKIRHRQIVAGPWTLVSGTIYKTTIPLTVETSDGEYVMAGRVTDGATTRRIYTATSNAPALNQQFYDGTDLYINVGADPTSMTVEVATRGALATTYTNAGIRIARPYVVVDGIDVDLFPGNGVRVGHASGGIVVRNVKATYSALDAFNLAAGEATFEDCEADSPGRRKDGGGSAGDGYTPHGSSVMTLRRCIARNAGKGGIAAEQAAVLVVEDCEFWDCYLPIILLAQGIAGVGSIILRRCIIHRSATAGQDSAIVAQAGLPAGYTITVENCTFIGDGTVRGKAIDAPAHVIVNQSGNTQTGFLSLT